MVPMYYGKESDQVGKRGIGSYSWRLTFVSEGRRLGIKRLHLHKHVCILGRGELIHFLQDFVLIRRGYMDR